MKKMGDIDYHIVDYEARRGHGKISTDVFKRRHGYRQSGQPLLGEERVALSEHAYLLFHILIDLVYLALDTVRHMVFPAVLLALPSILGSPLWLVRYFVKDLFLVLILACVVSFGTGIYKAVVIRKQLRV
ncbi:MAG: hypothetical protein NC543_08035 [bacterium]|nr:hypothetical protein [bacterium]